MSIMSVYKNEMRFLNDIDIVQIKRFAKKYDAVFQKEFGENPVNFILETINQSASEIQSFLKNCRKGKYKENFIAPELYYLITRYLDESNRVSQSIMEIIDDVSDSTEDEKELKRQLNIDFMTILLTINQIDNSFVKLTSNYVSSLNSIKIK